MFRPSLGALGAAATAYDTADTLHDVGRLCGQGNAVAAEDRITRFAAQNLGGWGGAVAGDQVADWIRDAGINNQQDCQGNIWMFDPVRPRQGRLNNQIELFNRNSASGRRNCVYVAPFNQMAM